MALSSQGVLACGIPTGDGADFRTVHPLSEQISPVSELVKGIRARVLSSSAESSDSRVLSTEPVASRENRERELTLGTLGALLTTKEALTLSTLNQYRAKEGYLFDEGRNQKIVADDPALRDFWGWVKRKLYSPSTVGRF